MCVCVCVCVHTTGSSFSGLDMYPTFTRMLDESYRRRFKMGTYLWWSLGTLYLFASQVRVTGGESNYDAPLVRGVFVVVVVVVVVVVTLYFIYLHAR